MLTILGYCMFLTSVIKPAVTAKMLAAVLFLLVVKEGVANGIPTECQCNGLSIRNDLNCVCKDRALSATYFYPLTKIPSNNLTAPVELFVGAPNRQRWVGEVVECTKSSLLKLDDMSKPTNATQATLVAFNNFDFNGHRASVIGPWLGNIRSTIQTMQILCGTMTTLNSGMFHGFSQLQLLVIGQTGFRHVDHGAFTTLISGQPLKLTELYIVGNPLHSFDWSVLDPVASSLESVRLVDNNVSEMHTSFPVSFPVLKGISLESNRLRSIGTDVIAAWTAGSITVTLGHNPLCPMDNLCRCCSLLPLFQFAKRNDALVDLLCGPIETTHYCEAATVRRSAQCSTQCTTFGNVTEIAQISDYDNCPDHDVNTVSCESG